MYNCHICGTSFHSSGGKNKHIESIHRRIRYECKICEKEFMQKNNLENHMRLHTNERPYKCNQCKNSYAAKKYLDRHLKTHLGNAGKSHECKFCQKKFIERHHLKAHVNLHTGENRIHKCVECGKILSSIADLRNHQKRHSHESPFACTKCNYRSKVLPDLKRHLLTHETLHPIIECGQCDKKFAKKASLHRHLKYNHSPNNYREVHVCVFCEKGFLTKFKLFRHLATHTKEKYYSCTLCEAEFSTCDVRDLHIKRHHTAERTFSCGVCAYRCLTLTELKSHEATHLPPGNFHECGICRKLLRSRQTLAYHHRRIHSGPEIRKRHKCMKCGKGFHAMNELKFHLPTHERGKYRYSCLFCGVFKTFRKEKSLVQHMAMHTGEKPWICGVCGIEIIWKRGYVKHMAKHRDKKLKRIRN